METNRTTVTRCLEIGPGEGRLGPDWTTLDCRPGPEIDVVHDIRVVPLPFPEQNFELVYMSHVLEHVPWFQTVALLADIRRVLVPVASTK